MNRIVIFASGNGTNAQNIVEYFKDREDVNISLILCNKKDAYVLERAKKLGIPSRMVSRKQFESEDLVEDLKQLQTDLIVLAGFLWLVPKAMLSAFSGRILNIHPALLPKFGGKGMYGERVHESVIAAGEKESGITIHVIDSDYDRGRIIFQAKCAVEHRDTAKTLANKVHRLEYMYFPEVIDKYIKTL